MSVDELRVCPTCSDLNGFQVFRHVSMFRVGRRGCALCEVEEELARYSRLQTSHVKYKKDHGPKPLIDDFEREGIPTPPEYQN